MDTFQSSFGAASSATSIQDYCERNESSAGSAGSSGGTIGYGGFQLGFSQSKAQSSSALKAICDKSFEESDSEERQQILRRSVNPVLAEAFSACIKACSNPDFGFDVKKTDLNMTVNIFQKRDGAQIRAFNLLVDDTDPGSDETESVNCILEAGGVVYQPRILTKVGVEDDERSAIDLNKDQSALVSCFRVQHEYVGAGEGGGVYFYPGYTLVLGVAERQISPYIPVRGSRELSSGEYKDILGYFEQVGTALEAIDGELDQTNQNVKFILENGSQ